MLRCPRRNIRPRASGTIWSTVDIHLEGTPGSLPRRHNRRPRLDPVVYGPSGHATHVNIGAYKRRPVLTEQERVAHLILECLRAAAAAQGADLFVYCLMPDHLHLVAAMRPGGSDIATLVKSFGIRATKRTKHLLPSPLFQRSFYDSVLRGDSDLPDRCLYVVENPVRRQLVEDWHDYPYTWLSPEIGS